MPKRPSGAQRWFMHAPVWLYRLHLGRLLGGRFLLLRHQGRKSGTPYENVLEVIGARGDEVYVVSGFGPTSSWVRNIRANPPLSVETDGRRFVPDVRFLESGEAAAVLAEYAKDHPRAADTLGKRLYGGSFRPEQLAAATVVVALSPRAD